MPRLELMELACRRVMARHVAGRLGSRAVCSASEAHHRERGVAGTCPASSGFRPAAGLVRPGAAQAPAPLVRGHRRVPWLGYGGAPAHAPGPGWMGLHPRAESHAPHYAPGPHRRRRHGLPAPAHPGVNPHSSHAPQQLALLAEMLQLLPRCLMVGPLPDVPRVSMPLAVCDLDHSARSQAVGRASAGTGVVLPG